MLIPINFFSLSESKRLRGTGLLKKNLYLKFFKKDMIKNLQKLV